MKMSQLFGQTLREAPSEAEIASHRLLLRAGYIRQLAAGIYSYLPLARRAMNKVETILREEMDAIGGQEITMPVVHPASLWQETGRWYSIDAEMGRFKDRADRDLVLAMTHEEVVADLVRREIHSYRQLPRLIYHIQTKWRDDPRPRAGLIRVREFTMKDSYSLDSNWEGLDRQYQAHYDAYHRIFQRCGLPVIAVKSDSGMMGGQMAHEFMYLTQSGEDTLLVCEACGFSANRQVSKVTKPNPESEIPLPIEKVVTPNCKTIDELAEFLKIPKSRTAKAVFMIATMIDGQQKLDQFIFAIVRGDMEVNETKLANTLSARELRPATEAEIRSVGAEPGYASPVGLKPGENSSLPVVVVVDDLIPLSPNLVSGANLEGFHLKNVNYPRDFRAQVIADITAARAGDACPECKACLSEARGVEVGNIFKLGTKYSEALGATFSDGNRQERPVIMGSYGIGVGRLLACIAEEHHDEFGLVWPISVAPYQVHMVILPGKRVEGSVLALGELLYNKLVQAGVEVLMDDRQESPGVKFNDADLIGLPLRLTVSERLQTSGMVELKRRDQIDRRNVSPEEIVTIIQEEMAILRSNLR